MVSALVWINSVRFEGKYEDEEVRGHRMGFELTGMTEPPDYLSRNEAWQDWVEENLLPFISRVDLAADAHGFEIEFDDAYPDEDGQISGSTWYIDCEE